MNSASTKSASRSFLRLLSLSKPYRGAYVLLIAASLLSTVLESIECNHYATAKR